MVPRIPADGLPHPVQPQGHPPRRPVPLRHRGRPTDLDLPRQRRPGRPYNQSQLLFAAYTAARVEATYTLVQDAGHTDDYLTGWDPEPSVVVHTTRRGKVTRTKAPSPTTTTYARSSTDTFEADNRFLFHLSCP